MPSRSVFGLLLILLSVQSAQANPTTFTATVFPTIGNTAGPCTGADTTRSGPTAQSLSNTCGPSGGFITGDAVAGPGHLGVSATASGGGSMRTIAEFKDQVVFSTLSPNTPQGNIFTALTLNFNGLISVGGSLSADQFSDAGYSLTISIGPNSFSRSIRMYNERASQDQIVNGITFIEGGETVNEGVSDVVSGLLSTPMLEMPLGQNVDIDVTLQLISEGTAASNDFLHSIDFPTGQDVFRMQAPDLYTANAAGLGLIDNRFGATGVGGVPEPGSLLLVGTALLAGAAAGLARASRGSKGPQRL